MKKLLIALYFIGSAQAENIAWMANQAGGKIILTNEICKSDGKTYNTLNRLFMFTKEGYTMEGCFYLDNELVNTVLYNNKEMKYPIADFTLYKTEKGTNL